MVLRIASVALIVLWTLPSYAGGWGADCEDDTGCTAGMVCDTNLPGEASSGTCRPTDCEADTDCEGGTVCKEVPGCLEDHEASADMGMPEPKDETCTPIKACMPTWLGLCEEDAECGDGMECSAVEICECSGGESMGGMPGETEPDSGDANFKDEESCTCFEEKACHPKACDDQNPCPDGFECTEASYPEGGTTPEEAMPPPEPDKDGETAPMMVCLNPELEETMQDWMPPMQDETADPVDDEPVDGEDDAQDGADDDAADDTGAGTDAASSDGNSSPGTTTKKGNSSGGFNCQNAAVPVSLSGLLAGLALVARRRRR